MKLSALSGRLGEVRALGTAALDAWGERPWLDWLSTVCIVGVHAVVTLPFGWLGGRQFLANVPPGTRGSVNVATAGVLALVGTFATAVLTMFISAAGPRMMTMRARFGATLRKSLRVGFTTPIAAAGLALGLVIADTTRRTTWPNELWHWLFETAVIVSAFRFARLALIFSDAFAVTDADLLTPERKLRGPALAPRERSR